MTVLQFDIGSGQLQATTFDADNRGCSHRRMRDQAVLYSTGLTH